MSKFGERLCYAQKLRNISWAELSRKTGILKGTLSSYKSGRYDAKQDNLYELARVLDVSESWLIGFDVPMERNEDNKYLNNGIGSKIRTIRKDNDINKEIFAISLGIDVEELNAYENGSKDVPYMIIENICSTYNISISFLIDDIKPISSIQDNIKELRLINKLTIDEVSKKLNLPQYYTYENSMEIPLDILKEISTFYGLPLEYILSVDFKNKRNEVQFMNMIRLSYMLQDENINMELSPKDVKNIISYIEFVQSRNVSQ